MYEKLYSCWKLHLIYSGAGMTREQESESEIIGRGDPMWSPECMKNCIPVGNYT